MAWEKRQGNNYYYRKVRDGDRVYSVYIGKSNRACQLSDHFDKIKIQKQNQQAQIDAEAAEDKELDDHYRLLIALAEATLLLNGYHLHKGEWKKVRKKKKDKLNRLTNY
jgi:hypothetical protein